MTGHKQKDNNKDKVRRKDDDNDKYIWRTPSNGNPTEVVKFFPSLTIENLKALQP